MQQIVQCRRRALWREQGDGGEQGAHRSDGSKGHQPCQRACPHHADGPDDQRHQRGRQQHIADHRANRCRGRREDQRIDPDHRIGPDLGHHRKQRRHRAGGRRIGARQPELQRHQRPLDGENQQQQHRPHPQQRRVALWQHSDLDRQVGHIERAGHRIDRGQSEQEQCRSDQVEGHILHPGTQPVLAAAVDHQPVRGDQQHLEKDKQVEQIARQEGPRQPHQLEQEQGVEMPPLRIPAGADGVKLHAQGEHHRQQQQQRRQPVQHQHDAKGGGPVAQQIDLWRVDLRGTEQRQRHAGQHHGARKAEDALQQQIVAHGQHDQRAQHGGQDDGDDDPMGHSSAPSPSFVSIRSCPVSRNAPSAIMTMTALIPKEITMAVSTSACVSGSV